MLHGLVRCRLPSAVCRQAGHCNFSLQFLKKKILKKNSHCNFSTNQAHRSTANSQRIRDTALSSTEEVFNLSWGPYCKYLMLPQCLSHEHTVSLTNTQWLSHTPSPCYRETLAWRRPAYINWKKRKKGCRILSRQAILLLLPAPFLWSSSS